MITPVVFWLSSDSPSNARAGCARLGALLLIGDRHRHRRRPGLDCARIEILAGVPRGVRASSRRRRDIRRFRFVNQFLVYLAVLAAGYARNYYLRDQTRQREAVVLEARAAELQAQLADARLDALRMQLNPHFLFNTLHAISALVERDPGGVRRMIARLSELLRHTIDSARRARGDAARRAASFCGATSRSWRSAFRDGCTVRSTPIDRARSTRSCRISSCSRSWRTRSSTAPAARPGEGESRSPRDVDGDDLVVTVQDNGPGVALDRRTASAWRNTRARLEQLYGDAASLSLTLAAGGGVRRRCEIRITLPRLRTRAMHA